MLKLDNEKVIQTKITTLCLINIQINRVISKNGYCGKKNYHITSGWTLLGVGQKIENISQSRHPRLKILFFLFLGGYRSPGPFCHTGNLPILPVSCLGLVIRLFYIIIICFQKSPFSSWFFLILQITNFLVLDQTKDFLKSFSFSKQSVPFLRFFLMAMFLLHMCNYKA